jgi:hypothetical protein
VAISSRIRCYVEVEVPRWRCPGGGEEIEESNFTVLNSRRIQNLVSISGCPGEVVSWISLLPSFDGASLPTTSR